MDDRAKTDPISRRGLISAIVLGALTGPVLAAANVYLGLKVGFTTDGSLVAALVAVALVRALRRDFTAKHTNLTQSAASAGAFCAVAGLTNAVPAMAMGGVEANPWLLIPWVFFLGALGVCIAVPLRRGAVTDERLRFPDAVACVAALRSLHARAAEARRGAKVLASSAGLAGAVVWLQQVGLPRIGALIPAKTVLPGTLGALSCSNLCLGVAWSPALAGIGAIVGLRVALSLALGGALGFVIAGPLLADRGLIEPGGYRAVVAWTVWPAVGLITSGAIAALVARAGVFRRALAMLSGGTKPRVGSDEGPGAEGGPEPPEHLVPRAWWMGGLLVAAIGSAAVARVAFGVPVWQSLVAVALALPLAAVAIRAVGETNIAPANNLAKGAQLLFAGLAPGRAVTNVAAAGVTAGCAQVGAEVMSDLKAGHELGNRPCHQFLAQLAGVLVSAGAGVGAYVLLTRAMPLGGEDLPAPTAMAWSALARGLTGDEGAVPAGAALAAWIAVPVGFVLGLAGALRPRVPLPSPVAVGLGAIFAPCYTAAILLGAVAAALATRFARGWWLRNQYLVPGGLIVGESLIALLAAGLSLAGVV